MCLGKNPSQPASVRAERVRRSGLHPIEKMLAFLRSVSRFLDTLKNGSKEPFLYNSAIVAMRIFVGALRHTNERCKVFRGSRPKTLHLNRANRP